MKLIAWKKDKIKPFCLTFVTSTSKPDACFPDFNIFTFSSKNKPGNWWWNLLYGGMIVGKHHEHCWDRGSFPAWPWPCCNLNPMRIKEQNSTLAAKPRTSDLKPNFLCSNPPLHCTRLENSMAAWINCKWARLNLRDFWFLSNLKCTITFFPWNPLTNLSGFMILEYCIT